MSDTKKTNEPNEQLEPRELTLDEMDNIAGGAMEQHNKLNQEQERK